MNWTRQIQSTSFWENLFFSSLALVTATLFNYFFNNQYIFNLVLAGIGLGLLLCSVYQLLNNHTPFNQWLSGSLLGLGLGLYFASQILSSSPKWQNLRWLSLAILILSLLIAFVKWPQKHQ